MMKPTMRDAVARNNTANADKSLTFLINSWYCGDT